LLSWKKAALLSASSIIHFGYAIFMVTVVIHDGGTLKMMVGRAAIVVGLAMGLSSCGGGVSKSELAQAIEKSDTVAHCLNLASAASERTSKERFDAGYIDLPAPYYGDPEMNVPPFIQAMVSNGILTKEGVFDSQGHPAVGFKVVKGNEGLFHWKSNDNARGGWVFLCAGDMEVEVVNFTEPAEEQNMAQVQYRYQIANTPPAFRTMLESGQIPREELAIDGKEVLLSGDGSATVVKTNNGWEVM
jgi:hypothetical protein